MVVDEIADGFADAVEQFVAVVVDVHFDDALAVPAFLQALPPSLALPTTDALFTALQHTGIAIF